MAEKEKDLKKLKRSELIEVIYQLKKNEQNLEERIKTLELALQEKNIKIERSGSVAEASLQLQNVFNTAQNAADIYLEEIQRRQEQTEVECNQMLLGAKKKAKMIVDDAMHRREEIDRLCQEALTELRKVQVAACGAYSTLEYEDKVPKSRTTGRRNVLGLFRPKESRGLQVQIKVSSTPLSEESSENTKNGIRHK